MCANQIDLNLPKGRKAQQRNMFFKSAPCKPVFPIYLLFCLSSLGFPRRWLQTDAGKFNLSIWDGPPDRPSLRERWGRRGQTAAAISESFLPGISELTSWKLSHPDEDVCTRWEHPKNSGRIIRHLNTIEVYQISLWHNTNTFKTSHKLFSWYKHCTHTHNITSLCSNPSCLAIIRALATIVLFCFFICLFVCFHYCLFCSGVSQYIPIRPANIFFSTTLSWAGMSLGRLCLIISCHKTNLLLSWLSCQSLSRRSKPTPLT